MNDYTNNATVAKDENNQDYKNPVVKPEEKKIPEKPNTPTTK